ncbi:MAG: hypothetical protein Q9227_003882 [Pyrenula ochraceoflavens]
MAKNITGGNRKKLLLALSFIGATACMLFILVFPSIYLVGSLLVVIGVTCLGNSFVLLNAFLPLLVANYSPSAGLSGNAMALHSPDLEADSDTESMDSSHSFVNAHGTNSAASATTAPALKVSNQISSRGVGVGYAAAVFVQLISICILLTFSKLSSSTSQTTLPMRAVLFVVGLWWAIFTIPTALWLRPRSGPPLPSSLLLSPKRSWLRWFPYITFAWRSLFRTIKSAFKLRQVLIFLAAWFLLSDAIATVSGSAILFARTELQMGTEALAGLSITATSSGIVGAFTWPLLARRWALESKYIIILCILLFEIIPLYGLLGFVPFVKSWGVGGLQQQWEIFPMGFILGFVMGGLSSYCRSLFGTMVPSNREAAFYALYAVTDKGSSVIGPAIVGRIVDGTGSIRIAFWFLAVLVVLPAPIVWCVNVEQGRGEALTMAGKGNESTMSPEDRSQHRTYEHEGLLAGEG